MEYIECSKYEFYVLNHKNVLLKYYYKMGVRWFLLLCATIFATEVKSSEDILPHGDEQDDFLEDYE